GIDDRDVLLDAVVGLHLEAPPVGPQRAAGAGRGQAVGDLVGLDAVVERGDVEAELLGQVEHGRHLVGAVAVDVHEDLALERRRQRLQLEVALAALVVVGIGAVRLVALVAVLGGVDEGRAIAGDVAHAGRGAALAAVHALRVLAAGHLHAPGRARELHALVGGGGDVLEGDAAAADQVGRAGQDLQRGDAAGARGVEAGVRRPHRMLGPDVGGDRRGGLVAVGVRAHARTRVDAEVRVHVDDAGRDPLAGAVDAGGAFGRLEAPADRDDSA